MLKLFKHVSTICSHHTQGDSKGDNVVQYKGFATIVGRMGKMQNGTIQQEGWWYQCVAFQHIVAQIPNSILMQQQMPIV
jgi:hypothetical protein